MRPRSVRAVTEAGLRGGAVRGASHADQALSVGVRIPPHQRCTLANGVKLVLMPRHDVPLIAFEAMVRGGARLDPDDRAGVASLAAELLLDGAGSRDAYAFADAVEGAGGSLDADTHSEAIALHGQFLSRDRELLLSLLADALQRPHFERSELDKLRERRIEFIKAAKDSEPQSLIGIYGRALLFAGHAYGKPVGGSEASLAMITREDVLTFYRDHFGAERLTLVFAGDFDPLELKAAVERRVWRLAVRRRAAAAARRHGAGARPAGAADRCTRLGADLFLDCQCRRRALVSGARRARCDHYRLRRQLRLDAGALRCASIRG